MDICLCCLKETHKVNLIKNFWNENICVECDKELADEIKETSHIELSSHELKKVIDNVRKYVTDSIEDCVAIEDKKVRSVRESTLHEILEKINEELEDIED